MEKERVEKYKTVRNEVELMYESFLSKKQKSQNVLSYCFFFLITIRDMYLCQQNF